MSSERRRTNQLCYGDNDLYKDEGVGEVAYTATSGSGAWQDVGDRRCECGRYDLDRR